MKGNHNLEKGTIVVKDIVFNKSKIQNERKSQLSIITGYFSSIVFNKSKIQNERKSQHWLITLQR